MMKAGEFKHWNDADDADLRRMWDVEGLSSGDIGYVMGRSRNSIIGRVRRLGLQMRDNTKTAPRIKPRKNYSQRPRRAVVLKLLPEALPGDLRPLLGSAWEALPDVAPVALVDLESSMCRWPIGEAKPYLFCGAHADGSYCAYHAALSAGQGTTSERTAHKWKEAA